MGLYTYPTIQLADQTIIKTHVTVQSMNGRKESIKEISYHPVITGISLAVLGILSSKSISVETMA